jgi:hypothetical protein
VAFSGRGSALCVTNRDTTNTLYFRIDGVTAVAAADETFAVLPLQSKTLLGSFGAGSPLVSIVGNGGGYSAEIF